ncbi:uncharacterized protein BCR38DRAFT_433653 [Pseudomassariella vexata]|uniref:DUF974 domain-containing protein n=1 Tax=Pseudomassariella vexata TaxID=1141098 RepID=A0A1Y2DZE6_9PEZI|nr:uncharacterized protein BCR38DRAFT_433653 [Pseudomassariella vexata]ORY63995.1 hypothetical protein BCR38DRAFT_433653 [Pseudomassariella vexata]
MSHQRYPSIDPVKEPHSVSLKVLRLSRPSLVTQHVLPNPTWLSGTPAQPIAASLAYQSTGDTNPDPFVLTPILNLPPSFGSAYVGETFSCTLCANHDVPETTPFMSISPGGSGALPAAAAQPPPVSLAAASAAGKKKFTRDVRIEAEMKTPGSAVVQKLDLGPGVDDGKGIDLEAGKTLQKIVNFDLKEEGNHVLAVTVSYYEATETSGRSRTFRKLYQFICKGSLIVRTKVGSLPYLPQTDDKEIDAAKPPLPRRWVMEAQLENCSEEVMQLNRVGLDLEQGLQYRDANWVVTGSKKPVLHPGEVEQVFFVVQESGKEEVVEEKDGRIVFGKMGIGWRTEMGNHGFLSTGKLGTRPLR